MDEGSSVLNSVTFCAHELDHVPFPELREAVRRSGVARVRGLFDRARLRQALDGITRGFDPGLDRKQDPRDSDAVLRNFQKLQIGANSGVGTTRTLGRFMRVLFNPIFAEDVLGMRAHFVRLARFRNRLLGLHEEHAVHGIDDGFFTCARLQQYPRGGGFMVPHRDVFARAATEEEGLPYFQSFMLLSEKGEDYHQGGAYIDREQARLEYEAGCQAGDVIIYDGRTTHGVADIDPYEPLELSRFGGRVVAFASLFRRLQADGDGYATLSRRAAAAYAGDI